MSERLLMVSQPTEGGVAVCVRELARFAVDHDVDVTVACPEGDLARWAMECGARWSCVPMVRAPSAVDAGQVRVLRTLMGDADVVHLHSSKAGALGRLALRSLGSKAPPSAFTPHNWSWSGGGAMGALYRGVEWVLAPGTNVVVCVATGEMAEGNRVLGERARSTALIPNGVDLSSFTPEGPVASRSPNPLVVLVGRLCEAKAQDLALRALDLMSDPRVRLRLVGDGPDLRQLQQQARDLGVLDRVEWQGHADPRPHLRAADVVVIPSRWDAAPLALAEAMACGAPVVCSNAVGSVGTLGDAGVVVPAGDPAALADAVDALLESPKRRRELGDAARDRALTLPTVEDSCREHLRLWRGLLSARVA